MKYLQILRPSHWTKNTFIFAALIFGRKIYGPPVQEVLLAVTSALGGFFCFCMASSAVYIFNDIIDREADRMHPEKRSRPIAAGTIRIAEAVFLMALCGLVAIVCSYMLVKTFAAIIIGYMVLMILYSLAFKKVMILDCIIIAVGFCLRAVAGAVVVGVFISPWLIICTFALCLFLGFGKRQSELIRLGENKELYRRTLGGYTPELLSHMLDVSSGLAIVCFLLYTMDSRTYNLFKTNNLVYTTPLVLYCVFRFSALIQKGRYSGPVELIIHDIPFQLGFVLWVLVCIAIIYANKLGFSLGSIWAY